MTLTDRPDFATCLHELAVALSVEPPGEEREPHYWRELQDYPLSALKAACAALRGKWQANWFPKPAAFRQEADLVLLKHRDTTRDDQGRPTHANGFHCHVCEDSGWEPTTRRSTIYGPEPVVLPAVVACGCRPGNPHWQRYLAEARRRGAEKRAGNERWAG